MMRIWTVLVGLVLLSFAAPAYADEPADNGSAAAEPAPDTKAEPKDEAKPAPKDEAKAAATDEDESVPADPVADKQFDEEFTGVSHEVGQAGPEISADKFRKLVSTARAKVLARMEAKIKAKSAQRMARIALVIFFISLAGVLLLLTPLFLAKKYPGKGAMLFKYSAIAAVTFFITVNLFGGVAVGFRSAQGALGKLTNPQMKIAEGFFDSLDKEADELKGIAPQLLAPTLYQLQDNSDDQPTVALIENGQRLIADAHVFVTIASLFKKLDWVFALIPTVLLLVTMLLFVLALRPTLMEIIRLPATVASGEVSGGGHVVRGALVRVWNEVKATLCTIAALFALTVFSALILGEIVQPALYSIIEFFGVAVVYLQIQHDASTGLVFASMFGVILFLALNLAVIILSIAFFLGKAQKIFQRRFHDHLPLSAHARFWKWGTAAVLVGHLIPLAFMFVASWGIEAIETKLIDGATSPEEIPWTAVMLIGPAILVLGFLIVFWAARGMKAIAFLLKYKVPPVVKP
jgi:hypothetical protein